MSPATRSLLLLLREQRDRGQISWAEFVTAARLIAEVGARK